MNQIENNFEKFEELYKPEYNQIVLNQTNPNNYNIEDLVPFGGIMYETFGEELEYVRSQPKDKIWTIIDDEDELYIISGFHIINRIGYVITKNSFKSKNETYSID
jgi:hypothetical protein